MKVIYDKSTKRFVEQQLGPGLDLFEEILAKGQQRSFDFTAGGDGLKRRMIVKVVDVMRVRISVLTKTNRKNFMVEEEVEYLVTEKGWIPVVWFEGLTGVSDDLVQERDADSVPISVRRHSYVTKFHKKLAEIFADASPSVVMLTVEEAEEIVDALGDKALTLPAAQKLRDAIVHDTHHDDYIKAYEDLDAQTAQRKNQAEESLTSWVKPADEKRSS